MSSLYKRANGPQQRMLAIVSGAVLNALHAHPEAPVDRQFARSVAKRAVGTLSAQWPEVLAAQASPSGSAERLVTGRRRKSAYSDERTGGAPDAQRSPVSVVVHRMGRMIGQMRGRGDPEAADAIIAAIKCLAPILRRDRNGNA
jgi:hypothetical protein